MGILGRGVRVLRCATKNYTVTVVQHSRCRSSHGCVRGLEYDRSGVDESRVVGSSHGWVALFNKKREDGDLFLWEPLSGRQIKLPPMETLPDAYSVYNEGRASVTKVIISCSPDEGDEECHAMMIYGPGKRLAFCRPFISNSKWTRIGDLGYEEDGEIWGRSYQEFVYSVSQKLFFCVTKNEEEEDEEEEEDSGIEELNYLVFDEQSAQLLLVKRHVLERMAPDGTYVHEDPNLDPIDEYGKYPHKTIAFDVDRVDDLDNNGGVRLSRPRPTAGLSIFLGLNQSFAISAPHDQLKPNSIYFTDPNPCVYMCETTMYGGHDIGVFDYENRTLSPCYYPCDVSSLKKITPPPFWFTPMN
ncbi:hypothetical protein OROGR_008075 [Orobanche gracilis]